MAVERDEDRRPRAVVYGNRNRLRSGIGKEAMRNRGKVVERSFAHVYKLRLCLTVGAW